MSSDASSAPPSAVMTFATRHGDSLCSPAQARSAAVGPIRETLQARTKIQAPSLMSDPQSAKLPPHGRRKRLAVDPERSREPWCCSGTVVQSRTAHATITTFCPQPPLSSSTYKNARRRTARALSQHFANLHSSHTKLENDTKWWASNRASWKVFGHTSRGKSHRHLVHDISTRQTRQFDRRTTRTECGDEGRILAAEKRRKDERLRGDFGGGRMWLGLVPRE